MPSKNQSDWYARRAFIQEQTDLLLREKTGVNSVRDAYIFIAENMLFCELSTIYRSLQDYNTNQTKLELEPVTQIKLEL